MKTNVAKPRDDLYVLEQFEIDPVMSGVTEFTYAGLGQVVQAPSAYLIKCADILRVEISQVHPAWLYSGMDYGKDVVTGYLTFRSDAGSTGVRQPLYIENIKKLGQQSDLIGNGFPSTFMQTWMDNVPITYYGTPQESRVPGQSGHDTILSKVIDESKIKVTQLSPCDFEIEVLEDLTDDQWFYVPVGNPKGLALTIWGKVGNESTLPEGAGAGLIKVRTESLLDAQRGAYIVNGDLYDAVTLTTQNIYQQEAQQTFGIGTPVSPPVWYQDLFIETYKNSTQYQRIKMMMDADTEYMACGYSTKTSTVGTGLFVQGGANKACVYPFGMSGLGLSSVHIYQQDKASIVKEVPLHDFIQVGSFLEDLAKTTINDAQPLPDDIIIPFAASELQVESKIAGPFRPLQDIRYNYRYMTHNNTVPVGLTPTYLPPDGQQHCYVPPLVCRGSTRVHMLTSMFGLDDMVSLTLKPHTSWGDAVEGTLANVPDIVLRDAAIDVGVLDDPIMGYSRGKMGFFGSRSTTTSTRYANGQAVSITYTWKGRVDWANPDVHPTVGRDYAQVGDKSVCNAVFGAMIMAFTGFFPAGVAKGVYKWKPFKTVEAQNGALNAAKPVFISSHLTPRFKPETTEVPYMGQNYITLDVKSVQWNTSADPDPYYTARRVLEYIGDDNVNTTRLFGNYFMTVNGDTVPLVGYPLANKPLLIDMDGWTGDWACEVDDMAMTAPFYDKDIDQWVIVGVSAQMQKMYRIDVRMDPEEKYCLEFLRVRDSSDLFDTPFGKWRRVLGICHTKDIHYVDGKEDDHLVLYGIVDGEQSTADYGSNLMIATCRSYMEWDADKDTISRIQVTDATLVPDFVIDTDVNWPHSVAVMYPWLYVLGYSWQVATTNPIVDPLLAAQRRITGAGWQMCLWKIEITSGLIQDVIPLKSFESMRFTYGIPANDTDARRLYRQDRDSVGTMMRYTFGTTDKDKLPVSANLPVVSSQNQFPSISGLACVSGSLMAFSNYTEKMVMINPLTGYVEELGLNVFPFIYPYNKNTAVEGEIVSSLSKFGGRFFHTSHPFFCLCLGDGTMTNSYGAGIDIQDVTNGQVLERLVKLKNNLLRDQLLEVEITVPEPDVLAHSEMLYLSTDGKEYKKTITVVGPIEPCASTNFFVRLAPSDVAEEVLNDKILLYVNAKFARKTVFFGYTIRLDAPLEV